MGIGPARRRQHGDFRQFAGSPQRRECLFRRFVRALPSNPRAVHKVRRQSGGTAQKGINIHIPVASTVGTVHKPRLRGDAHFIEQSAARQTSDCLHVPPVQCVLQNCRGFRLKFRDAMNAAACADFRVPAAEQTAAWNFPIQFLPGFGQHVHIKQPPQIGTVFQLFRQ